MRTHSLILASTSRYRRMVLERLGVHFEAVAPGVDESTYRHLAPQAMAETLAVDKALAVARGRPGCLVIGSDQVVATESDVFEKPGSPDRAVAQLSRLAGRSHRLITAVAVSDGHTTRLATDVHTLWMRSLSLAQIERYVHADAPLDCAGSYRIESLGLALFERVEADPDTADDTAIVGLPLMKTLGLLRTFGWDPLDPPAEG
jgi:septum formation protein